MSLIKKTEHSKKADAKSQNVSLTRLKKPLTKNGQARLAEEHYQLSRIERPKVVDGIATAAAEGDRSENAEYIYGKKRLRELDRRIRYLNQLLKDAQIIDPLALDNSQVCFACTVVAEDETGKAHRWMIVGEGEAQAGTNQISWKSPVARALFGKSVGDLVTARRPKGDLELEVVEILLIDNK